MKERLPRRLVAILYADVAGYSRLTGEDEDSTHHRLSEYLDLISSTVEGHRGRVMHYAGDAVLAMFEAVVDAVSGAVAIQNELQTRNQDFPDERKVQFRIGVNLGDVIEDRRDIYGDGVNVAARLESLADPGGICISESVRTAVGKKLDITFEDMGEQVVKNISSPIRTYRVQLKGSPSAVIEATLLPNKRSIAVLPFENMSGDPDQEYFSDGVAADIITALSKISHLFVIARNSSFTYKGRPVKVQQVAADLGVCHVLEGSVRKAGNRVRVSVQLIDGATGGSVWADRYDRELEDIFAVQDELTREIVNALRVNLTSGEQQRIGHKGSDNLEAYDCYLRGREEVWSFDKESLARARPFLDRAIELDPEFAAAYSTLSIGYTLEFVNRWSESPERSLRIASEFAQTAAELDDSDPITYIVMSIIQRWRRQHDRAIGEVEKAIGLDPNNAFAYSVYAITLHYAGRSDEALEKIEAAMRLDPYYPDLWLHFLGQIYFMLERYEEAEAALQRRLLRNSETDISRVLLAACYGHLGRNDAAKAEWSEALRINPDYSLEYRRKILPYKNPADFERIVEGLAKAGLPL